MKNLNATDVNDWLCEQVFEEADRLKSLGYPLQEIKLVFGSVLVICGATALAGVSGVDAVRQATICEATLNFAMDEIEKALPDA